MTTYEFSVSFSHLLNVHCRFIILVNISDPSINFNRQEFLYIKTRIIARCSNLEATYEVDDMVTRTRLRND